jgi:hypothetical protein
MELGGRRKIDERGHKRQTNQNALEVQLNGSRRAFLAFVRKYQQ